MYSKTIIIGNVGREANLKYTPQGIAVCDFTVAVNKVTGSGNSKKEKTTWFKVTVWRERAEAIANYVKKGMLIMCEGEIALSAYLNKDNKPAGSLELTAFTIQFLSRTKDSNPDASSEEPTDEIEGHEIPL